MNNYKLLITGASGFIGSSLLQKTSMSGFEVMAMSRSCPETKVVGKVHWLRADLSSPETYRDEIKAFSPDIVIHLSWQDIPDFSFEKSLLNLNQSLKFLSIVLEIESCKKILVSGSCLEYNKTQGECGESIIGSPRDYFTWAKHSIYSWLLMKCTQNDVALAWLRLFYVYGPGQKVESLIPAILSNLKSGKLPHIRTPKNANDYIFIDDVVDGFYAAMTNRIPSGIYNLGSGKSTSVIDVCGLAEKHILGTNILTQRLVEQTHLSSVDVNFWAKTNTTKKILNWNAKISLTNGIERTWDDFNKL